MVNFRKKKLHLIEVNNAHWKCEFYITKTSIKHRTFSLTMRFFIDVWPILNDAIFLSMFEKNVKYRANNASNDGNDEKLHSPASPSEACHNWQQSLHPKIWSYECLCFKSIKILFVSVSCNVWSFCRLSKEHHQCQMI